MVPRGCVLGPETVVGEGVHLPEFTRYFCYPMMFFYDVLFREVPGLLRLKKKKNFSWKRWSDGYISGFCARLIGGDTLACALDVLARAFIFSLSPPQKKQQHSNE